MKRVLILCLVVLGVLLGSTAFAEHKKVLVIHSYHPELPWTEQCNRGIISVFAGMCRMEYVYLDTKRIPESEFQKRAEEAMETFYRFQPDVVMIGDDNALRLLGPQISEAGTPVVFFGINNNPRNYFNTIPENVTGVLERVQLFQGIRLLKEVIPEARNVLVLMDSSPTASSIVYVTFGARKVVSIDGIAVSYAYAANWTDWQRIVTGLGGYDYIAMPVYHALKNDAGEHMPVEEVVRWTSANSPVPVFAYQDYAVGDDGVVGAFVIEGEAHARRAALLAKDILEGNDRQVPLSHMDQDGLFYFNRRQLKRYGLILPEGMRKTVVYR